MKTLFNILLFLIRHPYSRLEYGLPFLRFLYFQIWKKRETFIFNYYGKSRIYITHGYPSATATYYVRLYDYDDMHFLLSYLRSEDVFLDIGANVGIYSVLAAVETGCSVRSFEPNVETYNQLMRNFEINNMNLEFCYNFGLSGGDEQRYITTDKGAANHIEFNPNSSCEIVQLRRLDNLMINPEFIKIDVEGFESQVLSGGMDTFSKANIIQIELKGHGSRYGYDENEVHKSLKDLGFSAYKFCPNDLTLSLSDISDENYLYIKDIQKVIRRISERHF
jgi:FkbM family methyltransferase